LNVSGLVGHISPVQVSADVRKTKKVAGGSGSSSGTAGLATGSDTASASKGSSLPLALVEPGTTASHTSGAELGMPDGDGSAGQQQFPVVSGTPPSPPPSDGKLAAATNGDGRSQAHDVPSDPSEKAALSGHVGRADAPAAGTHLAGDAKGDAISSTSSSSAGGSAGTGSDSGDEDDGVKLQRAAAELKKSIEGEGGGVGGGSDASALASSRGTPPSAPGSSDSSGGKSASGSGSGGGTGAGAMKPSPRKAPASGSAPATGTSSAVTSAAVPADDHAQPVVWAGAGATSSATSSAATTNAAAGSRQQQHQQQVGTSGSVALPAVSRPAAVATARAEAAGGSSGTTTGTEGHGSGSAADDKGTGVVAAIQDVAAAAADAQTSAIKAMQEQLGKANTKASVWMLKC
jgi:hypothetical protein